MHSRNIVLGNELWSLLAAGGELLGEWGVLGICHLRVRQARECRDGAATLPAALGVILQRGEVPLGPVVV